MKKLGKNRKTLVRVAIGLILTLIFGFSSFVGFLGEKRSTEGESNLSLLGDAGKTQSNQDIEDFNPENNVLLSAYGTLEATDAVLFLNYDTVLGTVTGTVNGVETDFIIGEEGNVLAPSNCRFECQFKTGSCLYRLEFGRFGTCLLERTIHIDSI